MAVIVRTYDPDGLVERIQDAIDGGQIRTWTYDRDGDFTHRAEQWNGVAWLHPRITSPNRLVFSIINPARTRMTKAVYGVFHGRFIEMLLTHFDTEMEDVRATAMPGFGDDA